MSYISIHILEVDKTTNKPDSSIIIIYDGAEETFYLYGMRGFDDKYEPYSYSYHYTQLNSLCSFVFLVMSSVRSRFIVEYNNITIPRKDLDYVDHKYLYQKINTNNEIIGFEPDIIINNGFLKKTLIDLFDLDNVYYNCSRK